MSVSPALRDLLPQVGEERTLDAVLTTFVGRLAIFTRTNLPQDCVDWLRMTGDFTAAWIANTRAFTEIDSLSAQFELENEYLGEELELGDWLPKPETAGIDSGARTLQEIERAYIVKVMEAKNWRVSGEHGAANVLGLKPTTLEARMKKLGISRNA